MLCKGASPQLPQYSQIAGGECAVGTSCALMVSVVILLVLASGARLPTRPDGADGEPLSKGIGCCERNVRVFCTARLRIAFCHPAHCNLEALSICVL